MRFQPHPVTLRQLQYVVAVADLRSFRRAAEQCGVSPPSLSAQIAEVESQLGVQIFERDRRSVSVTAAGVGIVADARRALRAADDVVDTALRFRDPLRGSLRIGMLPTIAPYLLPCWSKALSEKHRELVVLWAEEETAVLVRRLHARELDAALVADDVALAGLSRHAVIHDPFVVAVPVGHPLAELDDVDVDDLRDHPLLLLDEGHCLRDQALTVCGGAGVREHPFRATSLQTLVQMVASGVGITLLPWLAAPSECARSALVVRPLRGAPGRELVLACRADSPLSSTLAAFAHDVAALIAGREPVCSIRAGVTTP